MTDYQQLTDGWQPDASGDAPRRLRRSRTDRVLAGVCGGVGRYLNIDPVVLRIITIALIFAGVGVVAYIIAWLAIPGPPRVSRNRRSTPRRGTRRQS